MSAALHTVRLSNYIELLHFQLSNTAINGTDAKLNLLSKPKTFNLVFETIKKMLLNISTELNNQYLKSIK